MYRPGWLSLLVLSGSLFAGCAGQGHEVITDIPEDTGRRTHEAGCREAQRETTQAVQETINEGINAITDHPVWSRILRNGTGQTSRQVGQSVGEGCRDPLP